jgi:serine/threonine-protein kinase
LPTIRRVSVIDGKLQSAWLSCLVATAVLVTSPRPAGAQASTDEKAAAEALFMHGKSLMKEGRYAEACAKFAESARLDLGIGTTLYLADCYEKAGRTASAWAEFRDAAARAKLAGQGERETIARARADALQPRLSMLRIVLDPGAETPGIVVKRDDGVVPRALWGTPIPVDPGIHEVNAIAPGKLPWSTVIHVEPTDNTAVTVVIPALNDRAVEIVPEPPGRKTPTPEPVRVDEPAHAGPLARKPEPERPRASVVPSSPRASTARVAVRSVAYTLTGLGLAGGALGGAFGVVTLLANNSAAANCRPNGACNRAGVSDLNRAWGFATAADIAFAAGGGSLGVGLIVLAVVSPPASSRPEAAWSAVLTLRGLSVKATF